MSAQQEQKQPVIAVIGPTASGKTALSLHLAKALGGEIIAMDSMQVYRGMDIGTAKPTPEEKKIAPHHMLDVADPGDAFSVAEYAAMAREAIADVGSRGKVPILVGGTGLYLQALMGDMEMGGAIGDEALRAPLEAMAKEPEGKERLHQMLRQVDPASAEKLHPNDVRRVVRALEVYKITGRPFSTQRGMWQRNSDLRFLLLGITMERALLYQRINDRVTQMMTMGLLAEVERLLGAGVPKDATAMKGIGYKELIPVLLEDAPLAEAVEAIQQNTRHYAKRQLTWFRRYEELHWLNATEEGLFDKAMRLIENKETESCKTLNS